MSALEYARRAAEQAQALYAPRAALRQFDRAIAAAERLGRDPPFALHHARGNAHHVLGDFEAKGATVYGVSCDAPYSQSAFREKLGVSIEQLSDFEPKGEACRAFGVYHPLGFPQRALVIIGPDAVVKWSYLAPSPTELPGANLIFDGLEQAAA